MRSYRLKNGSRKINYPLTNNEGRQLKSMSFSLSFKP